MAWSSANSKKQAVEDCSKTKTERKAGQKIISIRKNYFHEETFTVRRYDAPTQRLWTWEDTIRRLRSEVRTAKQEGEPVIVECAIPELRS